MCLKIYQHFRILLLTGKRSSMITNKLLRIMCNAKPRNSKYILIHVIKDNYLNMINAAYIITKVIVIVLKLY